MENHLTGLIEAWFAEHDGDEFHSGVRGSAFSVIGPATDSECVVFTTKPHIVSAAIFDGEVLCDVGMIGRYGLPSPTDIHWIIRVIGPSKLLFLGDMDPVDLLVFAWLRAGLRPRQVTHAGVNDELLKSLNVSSTEILSMPWASSEQQALPLLKTALPDLETIVGHNCAQMLKCGRKIELDGLGGDQEKRVAIAELVRSQSRRGG